jgi:hypothetical protein
VGSSHAGMDWAWLPGTVVGVLGVVGGAWIAVRGREHDQRMAKARFEHEQRSAHARWLRERQGDAYVQLLDMAERVGQWAAFVQPMTYVEGHPRPELPGLAEQAQVTAQVRAFGTPTIRKRMAAWHAAVRAMIDTDLAIRLAEGSGDGVDDRRRLALELRPA